MLVDKELANLKGDKDLRAQLGGGDFPTPTMFYPDQRNSEEVDYFEDSLQHFQCE